MNRNARLTVMCGKCGYLASVLYRFWFKAILCVVECGKCRTRGNFVYADTAVTVDGKEVANIIV